MGPANPMPIKKNTSKPCILSFINIKGISVNIQTITEINQVFRGLIFLTTGFQRMFMKNADEINVMANNNPRKIVSPSPIFKAYLKLFKDTDIDG